jgi:ribosomal protein S18 acetylase RimI-like enzyme
MRRYGGEEDYGRIRAFLRDVMLRNDLRELSWHVARMDYFRWHGCLNIGDHVFEESVFIWETGEGRIAGVLNPEGRGHAFLQTDPELRTPGMLEEMLSMAEERFAAPDPARGARLSVWADSEDHDLTGLLAGAGYHRTGAFERQGRNDLGDAIPEGRPPEGYTVRSLDGGDEVPSRSWLSWRAFHSDGPDEAYEGWEWYLNVQAAPLYRQDLDIVAVAPGGALVAFTTVWYDDVTRTAYIEPVGTEPDHRRRGLATAVMAEGLRRVERLGCVRAFVGGYGPATFALYGTATNFVDCERSEEWRRHLG